MHYYHCVWIFAIYSVYILVSINGCFYNRIFIGFCLICYVGASGSNSAGPGSQRGKRHASPAPSTTSSTSSASDERKPTAKFGKDIPLIMLLNEFSNF